MAEKWRAFLRYVNGEKQYNVGRYTRQGRYPGAIQYKGPYFTDKNQTETYKHQLNIQEGLL